VQFTPAGNNRARDRPFALYGVTITAL